MKCMALAIGISIASATAVASEIYRWTDEDGTVHYGDRPSGEADEQRVAIDSRPTDNAAVQQRYDEHFSQQSDESESQDSDEEEERRPTRAERRAEAAQRQADCERYRAQLERYESSRRLYREQENGERYWMDDNEIEEIRVQARALVAETCG